MLLYESEAVAANAKEQLALTPSITMVIEFGQRNPPDEDYSFVSYLISYFKLLSKLWFIVDVSTPITDVQIENISIMVPNPPELL